MDYHGMSDFELWSRFREGDDDALSVIYGSHSKKLYLYGLKFTADNSMIEDSIHDLFSDLIKSRRRIGTTENITFYLLKSIKRQILSKLAKARRLNLVEINQTYSFDITFPVETDLIQEEISKQKIALLSYALQNLSPRQKEVVYLRYSKELSYLEISEIMGISVEAIRNLISAAIKKLKDAIGSRGNNQIILFLKLIY